LPLSKWFMAIGLIANAKKGVSAKQMERDLGVNYRTDNSDGRGHQEYPRGAAASSSGAPRTAPLALSCIML
jgi:hypothetical protein